MTGWIPRDGSLSLDPSGWIPQDGSLSTAPSARIPPAAAARPRSPPRVHTGLWGKTATRTLGEGEGEGKLHWKAQICLFICCKVKNKSVSYCLILPLAGGSVGPALPPLQGQRVRNHLGGFPGSRKVLEGEQTHEELHTVAHMESCTLFQGVVPPQWQELVVTNIRSQMGSPSSARAQ